jgi:amidohydrolase
MTTFRFALGVALTGLASVAQAQTATLDADTEARIAALEPQVISWRRHFHEHPELSNREYQTAAIIAEHLRELGIEVQTGVAHTGVVGVLVGGRPGPVVALRADMDGLPITERVDLPFASKTRSLYNGDSVGVMHACGHDTHVAILMGVAEILAGMREEIPGTVKFIFQPAEEGTPDGEDGGAELMVAQGVLSNPDVDAIFALHIDALREAGELAYRSGGIWASADDLRITVRGRGSHGAYPWMGVDPIVTSAQIITTLQTIVSRRVPIIESAAVVTIGSIHGGNRSNIVPEEVVMVGTIRALDPEVRAVVHQRVRDIATNVAESMGATAEVQIGQNSSYPVTVNDPELTARMGPVLQAVATNGAGVMVPETGAEDFAYFANEVPGFYFVVGGRRPDVPADQTADHHTPDFFIDESGLIVGVRAMTALTLHYLSDNSSQPAP